ncbi:ATP-dependent helicase/nuclease subunit A [Angulomicrobium tetraedrale]|uniref:DNA 3'-5' helicase n=1 Tax=Ancylobacter tetraedralis TaxID=217068 RepID=A0A839ZFV0_9HYPH|nr:double-strand break repair helicase AddA [Ancylobacter tetraedralis]MBB3773506.1 ATP-dependent helicase/nuclease subunit A [Ancylobacter tetraedralis]
MSDPTLPAALAAATALQSRASDPDLSAWVSANAGSGKTHVLARRVIRLLMRGVPPGRILCLTYTKAAAANMANRVLDTLRGWVTLDDDALDRRIIETDGGGADPERRARARRLFAQALETPGGLKIQTIHAFCGALLHAFPFEAGVPAGFGELEEAARLELLARLRSEVVLEGAGHPESPLGQALALIVGETSDDGIDQLIAQLVADPAALEASDAELATAVGLEAPLASREVERRIVEEAVIARGAWIGLAAALIAAGGNAARRGHALSAAAQAPAEAVADAYANVFLKEDGEPYGDGQFGAAAVRAKFAELLTERDRIAPLAKRLIAARAFERSRAVLTLGREAARRYEHAKAVRGVLDFTDLIDAARRLLASGASAWVQYKLDQGIDHVLLDEAQDTSPEQWEVIRPLVAEFFSGEGARPAPQGIARSLFVVGDEKQSIFSFQGADPRRFDTVRREFEAAAGERFAHIRLRHSFRSAPGILGAVDTVFADESAYAGLSALAEPPVHEAIHGALPARVELWEPEVPSERVDVDAWQRPVDAPATDDPKGRLARNIAGHIAARIAQRFPVTGRHGTRPARPGDFLILVRRRDSLFEAIIRELKQAGVAVAGADRLVVAEHIAVMDLMALGDAVLARDDELALACALKSPLFGFDDDDLMKLAPRREGLLEDALIARAGENRRWADAAARLARLRVEAQRLRPFDFYARVLGRERGRAAMLARLGPEAADALDEMLALARAYENIEAPSLSGFLAFLRRGGAEAKRDMEAGRDEVRVMTVHGAKGLEAPYVILADTTSGPMTRRSAGLLKVESARAQRPGAHLLLHAPSKKTDTPAMAQARARGDAAQQDEYRRLLYVALTRAETALVLCGAEGTRKRPADCWYDLVHGALAPDAIDVPATGFAGTVKLWRIGGPSAVPTEEAPSDTAPVPDASTPEAEIALARALRRPLPTEAPRRTLRPSAGGLLDPAPEGAAALARRRGELLHRLMAGLAALSPENRAEPGRRLLAGAFDGPASESEELLAEALAALALPELAPLFGPGSLAEVPILGGLEDGTAVNGRIDRLVVEGARITLADFKTDRHVPARVADLPAAHLRQVALYARLLGRLYPDREIRALLVYTAGPRVLPLDAGALAHDLEPPVDGVTSV